jgi:adenosylmethionine-8-amino-7-oxononanoate aminotransferase
MQQWSERDKAVIWHPFTHQWKEDLPIPIVRGEGSLLFDDTGKVYVDAISSWWVNIHGHANAFIAERVYQQMLQLEHVIFAGFTHPSAIQLAEKLLQVLPQNQSKIFFSDNGSTAVEVAIKMVLQYWWNRNQPKRTIVAFKGAYHGDTFGAMAVGMPGPFNAPFDPPALDVKFIDVPKDVYAEESLRQLNEIMEQTSPAAFIFEPLVQGSGGMIMYPAEGLDKILSFCKSHNILTIADEVMTGFGRTGAFFACDHLDEMPDIMCLSKGITGGFMPLGITTATQEIYRAFLEKDVSKTFYHGHSYTGNPMACAAALASFELMTQQETIDEVVRIVEQQHSFIESLSKLQRVENVRQCGTILAFDVKSEGETGYFNNIRDHLYQSFIKRGVLLRPLGNTVYVMPPYCTSKDQLDLVHQVILEVIEEL